MPWRARLNADPLPWLLETENPAVRRLALTALLGQPPDAPEVIEAAAALNRAHPVKDILDAQQPEGYWVKPGAGYSPKYRSTVWQLIFLDQLGADGHDPRIRAACEYVLTHSQAANGGFDASAVASPTGASHRYVIHCLTGNLLRALLGFGYAHDERVRRAIEWQTHSITGDGFNDYTRTGTTGPGFQCAANDGQPCAWGAIKALRALARVPASAQTPSVKKAVRLGVAFLFSRDPAQAGYPVGNGRLSPLWFKLGFPSAYAADLLQNLEVLAELGHARDRRLRPAIEWLLARQDAQGRWKNQYAYPGQLWTNFERQGDPSKWVTLRACRVLKAAH